MSLLAHHLLLAATPAGPVYGTEDFSTYPDVTFPTAPLSPPRWDGNGGIFSSVAGGVLTVRAEHTTTTGMWYAPQADTAGKYVRVLLDWYAGIGDAERRLFLETNGMFNAWVPVLFYFTGGSAQVGLSQIDAGGRAATTQELTANNNPNLALSATEPTYLELGTPQTGMLEARTWGFSQPRPAVAGYARSVTDINTQYGVTTSLSGQAVLRSINTDSARVRSLAILP